MGSGTTAKIAHLLGRQWIGSEVSAEYIKIAEARLAQYIRKADISRVK
jgi:DNA modification methylase